MKNWKSIFLLLFYVILFCQGEKSAQANNKIIYIPLDNRPVCLSYVKETTAAAGYTLTTPPAKFIASHRSYGDNSGLWKWLEKEAPTAKAAVVSTDSLNYGGLVASRKHHDIERNLRKKIERMQALKTANPGLKIYAFSTIMRTPRQSIGNVEPDYYQYFGPSIFRLSQLNDKEDTDILSAAEAHEKAKLLQTIPADLLKDWERRRGINFRTNEKLITLCHDRVFHFLAIGKDDDAPLSQTHMEARNLQKYGAGIKRNFFQIIPGVDQIGLVLLTRAINELNGQRPLVYITYSPGIGGSTIPLYSDETIKDSVAHQIIASGAKETLEAERADIVLAINTPFDGVCQDSTSNENAPYGSSDNKKFAKEIDELVKENRVAVADISYANGADNGFMLELNNRKLLPKLTAYSGWNTADNSIGFALAQGILAKHMKQNAIDKLRTIRYLDDWIYQANIRYRVALEIDKHDFKLKYDLGKYYNKVLVATNNLFNKYVNDEPALQGTNYSIEFPWNRLFEIDVTVN